jgi:PAS domain S-box-containing protein
MDLAELLASDPVVGALDSSRLDNYLSRYSPSFPEYDSINVWDASGANVGASAPQPPGPARPSIADRPHFQQAMATGESGISSVLQARTTNRPSVAVVAVIHGPSGQRLGVVTVLMDLSQLPTRMQQVQVAPEHSILVADPSGVIAVDSLRPDLRWEERMASGFQPFRQALSLGSYAGIEEGLSRDEAQAVALVRSARYGWVAGMLAPESEVLGPLRTRIIQQAAVAGLALLVAALLAVTLTRSVTSPLRELAGAINAFGTGQMSRRAHVRTGDELEAAADTFNQMAATLQRQRQRLEFFGQLGAEVPASLDLDRMLEVLARRTAGMMGDLGVACLLSDDRKSCRIVKHSLAPHLAGEAGAHISQEVLPPVVEGVLLPAISRGESVFIGRAGETGEGARSGLPAPPGVDSVIAVPFAAHGRTVGFVAAMSSDRARRLTDEQVEIMREVSEIGGIAVENGLLYEELDRERRSLDTLIDRMAEGITIADGSGRILHLNRRARELLGHPPVEGRELGLLEHLGNVNLVYPDGRPVPFEERPIARALRGETVNGEEGIVIRPDGSRVHLLFSSGMVRDETGVRMAMTIYMDITPIREAERAREEFISVVAHDLRGPITSISGFADLLRNLPRELRGSAREQRALESILMGGRRLERMVSDLLDASRIESRRLTVNRERLDLKRFVPEVVERMGAQIPDHAVRVVVPAEEATVEADPGRLEQVLENLLTNAAKYSSPKSEVVLEMARLPGEVLVSVTNKGEGIATEEREAVFSRFDRTRSARGSRTPGTGLGLYITRGLVEAHGGRIWIEGEVNRYTVVRFTLPVVAAP